MIHQKSQMEYPNETAFASVKDTDACGNHVVICNGEILGHFNDILSAVLYTREEIKRRKFSVVIFTKCQSFSTTELAPLES